MSDFGPRFRRTASLAAIFLVPLAALCLPASGRAEARAAADARRAVVERVDRTRLERVVRDLSGANRIEVGGVSARLKTRYALSVQMDTVQRYLVEELRSIGYEPSLQRFLLTVKYPDLTGMAVSRGLDTAWTADTDGNVYRSTGADGWAGFDRCGALGNGANCLAVDPRGRLWAACTLAGSGLGGLFISLDGGASWIWRSSGIGVYSLNTISFADEQFGVAAGANGTVLHTADGGRNWEGSVPGDLYYQSFYGSAAGGPFHFWIVSDSGYLFETTNLGTSWDMRWLSLSPLWDVDFSDEGHGVIVGQGVTFNTRDGGMTWNEVAVPADLRSVHMIDSLRVMAGGSGGVFMMSEDGGVTWKSDFRGACASTADIHLGAPVGRDGCWFAGRSVVRRIDVVAPDSLSCRLYSFADSVWGKNVSCRREGTREPAREILLTAHFDSINRSAPYECAPGADDNASGVAGVIECARLLREIDCGISVEFVLFDGEELGLLGSRHFAGALDPEREYAAVINLDMIGYDQGQTFTACALTRPGSAADSVVAARLLAGIDSCAVPLVMLVEHSMAGSSDHRAFWDVGVPGLLIIEGSQSTDRTPYYHSCGDIASTLNYDFLAACTKAALAAALDLVAYVPPAPLPGEILLAQNRPNPFAATTTIVYSLPADAPIDLSVFDATGRRVARLEHRWSEKGIYAKSWDGRNDSGRSCSSGVYFIRLRVGDEDLVRKAVLVR